LEFFTASAGAFIPIPCSGRRLRPVKNRDNTIRATTTIINRKCSNYTTFGQLFHRKVIEIDATSLSDALILAQNASKMRLAAGPAGGAYSTPQTP